MCLLKYTLIPMYHIPFLCCKNQGPIRNFCVLRIEILYLYWVSYYNLKISETRFFAKAFNFEGLEYDFFTDLFCNMWYKTLILRYFYKNNKSNSSDKPLNLIALNLQYPIRPSVCSVLITEVVIIFRNF